MLQNAFGLRAGHDAAYLVHPRSPQMSHAAESAQEFLSCAFADPRDLQERAANLALSAPVPVTRHGETMGLVADLLNQVKDRRMPPQDHGLVLLPATRTAF